MIEIESRELADIPVLHAYPVGQKDTPLPCVIFYHGFTSSSLVYSYFAVALAQAGLRVIMPDAPDHGSRFSGDAARRLNQFWQILLQSMQEFTTLRAAIAEENWLLDDRLAVGGASMGAMTALGITARHPTVKCTASMMGSGYFTSLARSLFPPLIPETAAQQNEFNNIVAPLAEWGMTEKNCIAYLEKRNLMNPLYQKFKRLGCFFCPKQPLNSLRIVRQDYPSLWQMMLVQGESENLSARWHAA